MRQSILIVVIQIVNLLFGLYLTFYIAADVEPHKYALFAFYQIIITLISAFSFVGHETYAFRNMMLWEAKGYGKKISATISKTLASRCIMWVILILPVIVYIYVVMNDSYTQNEIYLVFSFIITGLFSSVTQSVSLILKSLGKYLFSVYITVIGMIFVKLIALIIYYQQGFVFYLNALSIGTIFLSLGAVVSVKKYVSVNYIKLRYVLPFRKRKEFILSAYMQYLAGYSDRIIISFFARPDVLSAYSIAKQVQEMGKMFIEGFFDPLTQKVAKYKFEKEKLKAIFLSLTRIHYIILALAFPVLFFISFQSDKIIYYLALSKYPYIINYIILAFFSSFIYLCYKIKVNVNAILLTPVLLLKYNILVLCFSISCVFTFLIIDNPSYLYGNRFFLEMILFLTNYFLYKRVYEKNIYCHV